MFAEKTWFFGPASNFENLLLGRGGRYVENFFINGFLGSLRFDRALYRVNRTVIKRDITNVQRENVQSFKFAKNLVFLSCT